MIHDWPTPELSSQDCPFVESARQAMPEVFRLQPTPTAALTSTVCNQDASGTAAVAAAAAAAEGGRLRYSVHQHSGKLLVVASGDFSSLLARCSTALSVVGDFALGPVAMSTELSAKLTSQAESMAVEMLADGIVEEVNPAAEDDDDGSGPNKSASSAVAEDGEDGSLVTALDEENPAADTTAAAAAVAPMPAADTEAAAWPVSRTVIGFARSWLDPELYPAASFVPTIVASSQLEPEPEPETETEPEPKAAPSLGLEPVSLSVADQPEKLALEPASVEVSVVNFPLDGLEFVGLVAISPARKPSPAQIAEWRKLEAAKEKPGRPSPIAGRESSSQSGVAIAAGSGAMGRLRASSRA